MKEFKPIDMMIYLVKAKYFNISSNITQRGCLRTYLGNIRNFSITRKNEVNRTRPNIILRVF